MKGAVKILPTLLPLKDSTQTQIQMLSSMYIITNPNQQYLWPDLNPPEVQDDFCGFQ